MRIDKIKDKRRGMFNFGYELGFIFWLELAQKANLNSLYNGDLRKFLSGSLI
jgi:hypothetical protein